MEHGIEWVIKNWRLGFADGGIGARCTIIAVALNCMSVDSSSGFLG